MATLDADAIKRGNASGPIGPLSASPERAVIVIGLGAVLVLMAFRIVFRELVL